MLSLSEKRPVQCADPPVALTFPGQGSQAVGMLSAHAQQFPEMLATYDEASEVLGYDMWTLTAHGPAEQLDQTTYTQPALLTASIALWRSWIKRGGVSPAVMLGHSLGEYSALTCAGALTFKEALKLVAARGRLMQDACTDGGMGAILSLSNEAVEVCCQQARSITGHFVAIANFNAPGQLVISGQAVAVAAALKLAQEKGAKYARRLPISIPAHCDLMRASAEEFRSYLDAVSFQPPQYPVLLMDSLELTQSPEKIKRALYRQLFHTVNWVNLVQHAMDAYRIQTFLEVGPGKALSQLTKRILSNVCTSSLSDIASFYALLGESK